MFTYLTKLHQADPVLTCVVIAPTLLVRTPTMLLIKSSNFRKLKVCMLERPEGTPCSYIIFCKKVLIVSKVKW
jgi:hypothetical protein